MNKAQMLVAGAVSALAVSTLTSFAGPLPPGGREKLSAAWGVREQDWGRQFMGDGEVAISQIAGSCDCNLAYPGDSVRITAQFRNQTANALSLKGRWILLHQGLHTGKDSFDLTLYRIGDDIPFGEPVDISIDARGSTALEITPPIPETFGSYAILFERDNGTRLLLSSVARIVDPQNPPGRPYYQIVMDLPDPLAIKRLQTAPNRMGASFHSSVENNCEQRNEQMKAQLRAIGETGYPICVEWGAGNDHSPILPLGRTRPHLTDDNVLLDTKSDFAWLPQYDEEFRARVKEFVAEFGYPRGPINGLMLWNEPWNGMSISGWGADDLRYREIYTAMCQGAEDAMAENPALQVLLGGCDSSANTFDKLFCGDDWATDPDEAIKAMPFLKRLDFLSLHYQALSPSNPRFLRDRKHPRNGRTMFWDTESWCANSEDRIPGTLAAMLAAGHDRIVGIQSESVVCSSYWVDAVLPDGKTERRKMFNAWSSAPALAALQRHVGNRKFKKLAWEGLPWVFEFAGEESEDDLTAVVCGDISPAFDGPGRAGIVPFRTCRPIGDGPLAGTMTLSDASDFALYDCNGNRVGEPGAATLSIPLNDTGYYLRASGAPGSGAALLAAIASARIDGYSPVAPVLRDADKSIPAGGTFTAELKNVLNRPVKGALSLECDALELAYDSSIEIAPHATAAIPVKIVSGTPRDENSYLVKLAFDAGEDGSSTLEETLHCNVIHSRTIKVDGDLSDWAGALAQSVKAGGGGATQMEKAWLPMVKHDETIGNGVAVAWVAADDDNFYFAAQIADSTPFPGMMRFATRDEDADFYPDQVFQYDPNKTVKSKVVKTSVKLGGDSDEVWEPLVKLMEFSFTPPMDGCRLAIRAIDDDFMARRWPDYHIFDAGTGKQIDVLQFHTSEPDTWACINVPGGAPVRVELSARVGWLRNRVAAIAIDPWEEGLGKGGATDVMTKGDFAGKYGKLALFTPASCEPGEYNFQWKDEIVGDTLTWPEGVRHYSYRHRPALPQGAGCDNVQIAFNVLPDEEKRWYPAAPGTFKGYAGYWDTDYEFALNQVAEAFGGGYEVWRCRAPYLPDKHYYPHSVRHPREGAADGARLVVVRDDASRIVEAAIPWSEMPEVKAARDSGKPIKFTYRVNDNGAGGACMELSYMRSVAKRNESFKPNWIEHWANELVFGWEK